MDSLPDKLLALEVTFSLCMH